MATKKQAKPATEAQKRARERNWNKGQILCIRSIANNICNSKTTTKEEKSILISIAKDLESIHRNWNK